MGTVKVTPIAGSLGSAVTGVDVRHLGDDQVTGLRDLLAERQVLFFPGQAIDPSTLQTLAEAMGTVRHITQDGPPAFTEFPEVSVLESDQRADRWHTDLTYLASPNPATALLCAAGPEGAGSTMWSSTRSAYGALSEPFQQYLGTLSAVHTARNNGHPEWASTHPVVLTHPKTGAAGLYVNRHYTSHIDGIPREESDAVLSFLFHHIEQVRFTCRWQWTPGDLCIWDNRATQHIAINDYPDGVRRTMYRISTSRLA